MFTDEIRKRFLKRYGVSLGDLSRRPQLFNECHTKLSTKKKLPPRYQISLPMPTALTFSLCLKLFSKYFNNRLALKVVVVLK